MNLHLFVAICSFALSLPPCKAEPEGKAEKLSDADKVSLATRYLSAPALNNGDEFLKGIGPIKVNVQVRSGLAKTEQTSDARRTALVSEILKKAGIEVLERKDIPTLAFQIDTKPGPPIPIYSLVVRLWDRVTVTRGNAFLKMDAVCWTRGTFGMASSQILEDSLDEDLSRFAREFAAVYEKQN